MVEWSRNGLGTILLSKLRKHWFELKQRDLASLGNIRRREIVRSEPVIYVAQRLGAH
jgi:hypothetical protein